MRLDNITNQIYIVAVNEARMQSHEYLLPEHFLYASLLFAEGKDLMIHAGADPQGIMHDLTAFFAEHVPKKTAESPVESMGFIQFFEMAAQHVASSGGKETVSLGDLLAAFFNLRHSYALYIMTKNGADRLLLLKYMAQTKGKISKTAAKEKEIAVNSEFLDKYTQNLTSAAKENILDPLIGREAIMDKMIMVLCRRLKNNPVLIGDPGVGKTAIIEGLAQRIVKNKVPSPLRKSNLFYVDMPAVLAGTKYRGDFEERLINILNEIAKYPTPIVYIDEIHNIVGAGAVSGGSMDATGILKPFFAKGEIRFIGSTTFEEYKKYFEKDRALTRRFLKISVEEPTFDENVKILEGIKFKYEGYHNVIYSEEIIVKTCELANRYLKDRAMPDKAIDIIDETGARIRMSRTGKTPYVITADDVESCVAEMAGVPKSSVSEKEADKLKNIENNLSNEIFGQEEAIGCIAQAIKLSRSGLMQTERPVANLLFVGPTGVGKTEIAKALASLMNVKLIRYDMSEYQEKHSVARLIGSPPGYVGYEEGGLLTDTIRKSPHAVLLLDEIEKAHPDIMNVLLQVMDYGVLTDNTGKKADFRNVIIIMTSNAGAREIGKRVVGFESRLVTKEAVDKEVERVFSPEFRNRLDQIIVFNHISEKMAKQITRKAFSELSDMLKARGFVLDVPDDVTDYIAKKGMSEKYGAREIMRIINTEIKKLLAEEVLFGDTENKNVCLSLDAENKIIIGE